MCLYQFVHYARCTHPILNLNVYMVPSSFCILNKTYPTNSYFVNMVPLPFRTMNITYLLNSYRVHIMPTPIRTLFIPCPTNSYNTVPLPNLYLVHKVSTSIRTLCITNHFVLSTHRAFIYSILRNGYQPIRTLLQLRLHEVHRRHPQYFIPLHSIHTGGNLISKISFSWICMRQGRPIFLQWNRMLH